MKTAQPPRTHERTLMLGVLILAGLELVALATAPREARPVVGGALIGVAAAAVVVVLSTVAGRRSRAACHVRTLPTEGPAPVVAGFPMDAVRPWLLGREAPSLNRLYTAWVFATHGHDAPSIARRLDLAADLAELLVGAAARQARTRG